MEAKCVFFLFFFVATQGKVLLIYTGGTIGMVQTSQGFEPEPGYLNATLFTYPQFFMDITPSWDFLEYKPLLDSSNIKPADWLKMATDIRGNYNEYDGFVIIHGTDTMAYTSAALSMLLDGLNKTVVVTGSMIPLSMPIQGYTDGLFNLLGATIVAGKYQIPEVTVFINNVLMRGNRMQKVNSWSISAFNTGNFPALGVYGSDLRLSEDLILPFSTKDLVVPPSISINIHALELFPGITGADVLASVPSTSQGLVLLTYGAGNAPVGDPDFLAGVKAIVDSGVVVVDTTQCHQGGVDIGEYATSSGLADIGVISGYDMTPEAALAKLAYLFGTGLSAAAVGPIMGKPIRGELTLPNTDRIYRRG